MSKKDVLALLRFRMICWVALLQLKLTNTLLNPFFHLTIIYWATNICQGLGVGFRDTMANKTKKEKLNEQDSFTFC